MRISLALSLFCLFSFLRVGVQARCSESDSKCRETFAKIMQSDLQTKGHSDAEVRAGGFKGEILIVSSSSLFGKPEQTKAFEDAILHNTATFISPLCSEGFTSVVLKKAANDRGDYYDLDCSASHEPAGQPLQDKAVTSSQSVPQSKKGAKLCAKHTDWTARECDLIANHRIAIGMTHEQVHEAWETGAGGVLQRLATGGDHRSLLTQVGDHTVEVWDMSVDPAFINGQQISNGYSKYVYFEDGRVTGWSHGN